ncbi:MAG: PCYCGC domain-containing protein [Acidobacteriota bacterium]|nr:PCYCGC domain-containing protein [Acidobacteriota bacterium]
MASLLLLAGCDGASNKTQDAHTNHQAANAAVGPTPRIPAHFTSPDAAKPLPAVLDPKQFSDPVISKAYRYAQENPEVFAQQPCYCYCDAGESHRSLLDCYASDHSVGCVLCQKEGLLVHKLLAEGKNATEIRDLIVRGDWQAVKLE